MSSSALIVLAWRNYSEVLPDYKNKTKHVKAEVPAFAAVLCVPDPRVFRSSSVRVAGQSSSSGLIDLDPTVSGVVKVPPHQLANKGVQDHLEDAIRRLKPLNPVSVFISSRTDTGVHALSNSAHFDLQRKNDRPPFTEDILVEALNFHLRNEQIRITSAHRVHDDFHARFLAQSRTYVYRIALGISHRAKLPLTDYGLCWNLHNMELDVGAMRQAAALLVGTHDFSSFRAVNSDLPFKSPVKTLDVVNIQPGSSFAHAHFHREIPFWELTFSSRSFLYKQVRRMTGALVAVGQGRLSVPQLKDTLEARDTLAYPQGLAAPPQGLFLTNVDYRDTDLRHPHQMSEEQQPTSLP